MKRYIQIIWDNLFLKTFNYKGRTNADEYLICTVFWWIIFILAFPAIAIESSPEFLKTISAILGMFALYLQIVPFTSLRVRRLHDTGKDGSFLIAIYFLIFVFGIGFFLMRSTMYDESIADDKTPKIDEEKNDEIEEISSIEDVEL
jgi:uncharacterized membrane protein YhaH (DUF805 family)